MLNISFTHKLSLHARHVLKEARDIARYTRSTEIEPRHLLLALTLEHGSLGSILLDNIGFKKEAVGKLCLKKNIDHKKKTAHYSPSLAPETKDILKRAYFLASHFGYPYVGTEHLVSALLESESGELSDIIASLNIDDKKINSVIESHLHFEHFPQLAKMFDMPDFSLAGNRTKEGGSGATPFLDQYTTDLARDAEVREEILIGREREIERLLQILGRKQKNNALLMGEPGVGKTAIVAALARRIETGEGGLLLSGKRILSLDLTLLVAGTSFRGEFEARIKEVLREAKENKNTILFIDEIHTLIGTGNTNGGLDAANILKPSLARGELQCIGATTFAEYKKHLEKDAALDRRFQTLAIGEPTVDEAKHILSHVKHTYEHHHQVAIHPTAVSAAVDMSVRYLTERFLPDKAFDLLDEAASLVRRREKNTSSFLHVLTFERERDTLLREKERLIEEGRYDDAGEVQEAIRALEKKIETMARSKKSVSVGSQVTDEHIREVVAQMTGVPFEKLSSTAPAARLQAVRRACAEKIIGQKEAIEKILSTLSRSISGVNDPHRPLGSFLFLGPTGVGKTHVAKILAKEFFGDERALIRLDMSEFMERHSVAQILGAPAGYIGYGEGGKLTEEVRRRPYSVILFDEIEKAHPDVFNLLLQVLDEGMLTDAEGRKISFKNTLIILTSNIGTASFTDTAKIGFAEGASGKNLQARFDSIKREVLDELKKMLRPELLARLDNTVVFNALDGEALEKIAKLALDDLKTRLKKEGIELKLPVLLVKHLAKKSFDPREGARLIRKNVQGDIEHKIAECILKNPGKKTFILSVRAGKVVCR